jgi:predicted transcriptional regulator
MSAAEIKKTKAGLIDWINHLADDDMLMALDALRNRSTGDWWDELLDTEKAQIDEGLADADAGRVMHELL